MSTENQPLFDIRILSPDSLYKRLQTDVGYRSDKADLEELVYSFLFHSLLGNESEPSEFPWLRYTVPEYEKWIADDPLFQSINLTFDTGLSYKEGEYFFAAADFWFHPIADQLGLPYRLFSDYREVSASISTQLVQQGFSCHAVENDNRENNGMWLNISDDTLPNVGMYFSTPKPPSRTGYTQVKETDDRELVFFQIDLPTDQQAFFSSIPKAEAVIKTSINTMYSHLGLTPSQDMKVEIDYD